MLQAANYVQAVEERQGLMISCPEEIAFRMGYISASQLQHLAAEMRSKTYGEDPDRVLDDSRNVNTPARSV